MSVVILRGDAACLPIADCSVDAIVTDPPYGLEFMGREWDTFRPSNARIRERVDGRTNPAEGKSVTRTPEAYVAGAAFGEWCEAWARECLRVLKPGGYLAAFGGTRTYHWLACGIELAGFEIRDSLHWMYGSGFPKGNACLKPAHEPIIMARKPSPKSAPLPGLNGCRVEGGKRSPGFTGSEGRRGERAAMGGAAMAKRNVDETEGRWPPNVLLTHSADCERAGLREVPSNARSRKKPAGAAKFPGAYGELVNDQDRAYGNPGAAEAVEAWDCAEGCPAAGLDRQSGIREGGHYPKRRSGLGHSGGGEGTSNGSDARDGYGGASRFFPQFEWSPECDLPFLYQAKASARERPRLDDGTAWPTVKPVALMRWLVRLVTPPGGTVLDLFCGTGPTGEAAMLEGFDAILSDRDPQALALTQVRLAKPVQPSLFGEAS